MSISRTKMLQVSKCLIGLAVRVLQSCDVADNRRDLLCGNWESVEGKPDVLIYKEGLPSTLSQFPQSRSRRLSVMSQDCSTMTASPIKHLLISSIFVLDILIRIFFFS